MTSLWRQRRHAWMQRCAALLLPQRGGALPGCARSRTNATLALSHLVLLQRAPPGGSYEQVVVQPYLNDALEFSVCVIDTPQGPVALPPTEVRPTPRAPPLSPFAPCCPLLAVQCLGRCLGGRDGCNGCVESDADKRCL